MPPALIFVFTFMGSPHLNMKRSLRGVRSDEVGLHEEHRSYVQDIGHLEVRPLLLLLDNASGNPASSAEKRAPVWCEILVRRAGRAEAVRRRPRREEVHGTTDERVTAAS